MCDWSMLRSQFEAGTPWIWDRATAAWFSQSFNSLWMTHQNGFYKVLPLGRSLVPSHSLWPWADGFYRYAMTIVFTMCLIIDDYWVNWWTDWMNSQVASPAAICQGPILNNKPNNWWYGYIKHWSKTGKQVSGKQACGYWLYANRRRKLWSIFTKLRPNQTESIHDCCVCPDHNYLLTTFSASIHAHVFRGSFRCQAPL